MQLTTPIAIVMGLSIAGAFVGVGLFAGLRATASDAAPAAPSASTVSSTSSTSSASPSSTSSTSIAPTAAIAPDVVAVRSEVRRALDSQKASLLTSCWAPSVSKNPEPARAEYVLNFTFDATGKQIARGLVSGDGGLPTAPLVPGAPRPVAARADVTSCLASALAPVTITPPGRSVYVTVPFSLP